MGQKDLENKSVEKFVNVFVNENIYEIAAEYEEFKKDAVLNFKYYEDCATRITEEFFEQISNNKIKVVIYNTMILVWNLRDDLRDTKVRQRFIDNIGEQISWGYEVLKDKQERDQESVRFLLMHMILDMCFASVDEKENGVSRLRLPAMFYDLMHKWNANKELPEDFRNFYGEAAEQDILDRTWENVKLYCDGRGYNPIKWSETQLAEPMEYVQRFGKKFIEIAQQGTYYWEVEKTSGKKKRKEKYEKAEDKGERSFGAVTDGFADDSMGSSTVTPADEPTYDPRYAQTDDSMNDPTDDPAYAPTDGQERNWKERRKEDSKPKEKGFSRKGVIITIVGVLVILAIVGGIYFKATTGSSGRGKTTLNYSNTISAPLLLWDHADEEVQKGDIYEYFSRN